MQGRARQDKAFQQFGRHTMFNKCEKSRFIPAVKLITDDREAGGKQMGADLVESSRLGKTPDERNVTDGQDFLKSRYRTLIPSRPCPALLADGGLVVASDGQINEQLPVGKISVHQGEYSFDPCMSAVERLPALFSSKASRRTPDVSRSRRCTG